MHSSKLARANTHAVDSQTGGKIPALLCFAQHNSHPAVVLRDLAPEKRIPC